VEPFLGTEINTCLAEAAAIALDVLRRFGVAYREVGCRIRPTRISKTVISTPSRAGSRNSAVKFDLPSFGRRPRLANLETNVSDLGPLATLPEEDLSNMSEPRRSLFKRFADKISVQKSPKSPV
jgi:hypothetical protein